MGVRKLNARPLLAAGLVIAGGAAAAGADPTAVAVFRKEISPILEDRCYECHGDGRDKGRVAFDTLTTDREILNPDLWLKVLLNTRAGLMPAERKPRTSPEEQAKLERWIKYQVFAIDPGNPDPGRVTVRRLNRVEYRNSVRDLLGVDFNTELEFPPDDTGYGFDTIGDALTMSPMLMEKYVAAAQAVVAEGVPTSAKKIAEQSVAGSQFTGKDSGRKDGKLRLSYYEPATVQSTISAKAPGTYRLVLDLDVDGSFEFDPGRVRVVAKVDGKPMLEQEFGYFDDKSFRFESRQRWKATDHQLTIELQPLSPADKKVNPIDLVIRKVVIQGPLEPGKWVAEPRYRQLFPRPIPTGRVARVAYARELLGAFATRAYRRPLHDATADRLARLAENEWNQPGKSFETGIAHAMAAVLASPRFLFRVEQPARASIAAGSAYIDEYSLASRLSYFLWSTMPDQQLLDLAARGQLRTQLAAQVKRMLADPRSEQLVQNFTGQWLQTRDVAGVASDAAAILARDNGEEKDRRAAFDAVRNLGIDAVKNGVLLRTKFGQPKFQLDDDLRTAMRRETEMFVSSIVHEDRPVTELIDSDYTFLNEKLAKLYGISGVTGNEMRRVALPAGSPRGGVLTQGSSLVVTSNPDRTSPVKRGLFVLDNFLGTPTPPPPANVPALEASEKDFGEHEPTLRESLQLHREKPLCASCHNRMDPIGLAFENFNAMGMWRDTERKQPIVAPGQLVTGETFSSVIELKRILATEHRQDFYRTLSTRLLTYAVGRGTEYYDTETIDRIVRQLQDDDGRFSALLMGVVESAPFQKMRTTATTTAAN
jgi:hypothetical protein